MGQAHLEHLRACWGNAGSWWLNCLIVSKKMLFSSFKFSSPFTLNNLKQQTHYSDLTVHMFTEVSSNICLQQGCILLSSSSEDAPPPRLTTICSAQVWNETNRCMFWKATLKNTGELQLLILPAKLMKMAPDTNTTAMQPRFSWPHRLLSPSISPPGSSWTVHCESRCWNSVPGTWLLPLYPEERQ